MPNVSKRPDHLRRLSQLKVALQKRQILFQGIRAFFSERDFLEVDTPIRLATPALEDYIDAEPAGSCYLRTSPELHMKQLLAAGYERIFQLGSCFRQNERGRQHRPEFTMLEWYRTHSDYREILADTRDLLLNVANRVNGQTCCTFRGQEIDLQADWEKLSVDEAFERHVPGTSLDQAIASGQFEELLVTCIEPHLGTRVPTVLRDYPLELGGLARARSDNPQRAERWELYINGLELANAYSELTDAEEQRRRFAETALLRQREGREVYPLDEAFMSALESGIPPSGGIALGVDRLLMVLTNSESIDQVVAFPDA
jgi:lysyl-tRNA synthetase class 2